MSLREKRNYAAPRKSVGTVVINGKVNRGYQALTESNRNPYYKMPTDGARHQMNPQRGDIVFDFHSKKESGLNFSGGDALAAQRETSSTKGITTLNGHADVTETNYDIMNKMRVIGIVEQGTDGVNKELFNILVGGVHETRCNGNETIPAGCPIMAYCPRKEEVKKGGGSNQTAEEMAGVVKPWYSPYDRSQRNELKPIYESLSDRQNVKRLLPAYREHCHEFLDSVYGMSTVVMAEMLPELRKMLKKDPNVADEDILTSMLTSMGHSEFKGRFNQPLVDSLFVSQSNNNVPSLICKRPEGNAKRTKLNSIQKKSTGQFLRSTSDYNELARNLVFATAVTTGKPGEQFLIKLT